MNQFLEKKIFADFEKIDFKMISSESINQSINPIFQWNPEIFVSAQNFRPKF